MHQCHAGSDRVSEEAFKSAGTQGLGQSSGSCQVVLHLPQAPAPHQWQEELCTLSPDAQPLYSSLGYRLILFPGREARRWHQLWASQGESGYRECRGQESLRER